MLYGPRRPATVPAPAARRPSPRPPAGGGAMRSATGRCARPVTFIPRDDARCAKCRPRPSDWRWRCGIRRTRAARRLSPRLPAGGWARDQRGDGGPGRGPSSAAGAHAARRDDTPARLAPEACGPPSSAAVAVPRTHRRPSAAGPGPPRAPRPRTGAARCPSARLALHASDAGCRFPRRRRDAGQDLRACIRREAHAA